MENIKKRLRCNIFDTVLDKNIYEFEPSTPSFMVSRMVRDVELFGHLANNSLPSLLKYISVIVAASITLFIKFDQPYFMTMLVLPFIYGIHFLFSEYKSSESLDQMSGYVFETLQQIRTIKALNHDDIDRLVLDRYIDQLNYNHKKEAFGQSLSFCAFLFVSFGALALCGLSFFEPDTHFLYLFILLSVSVFVLGKKTYALKECLHIYKHLKKYTQKEVIDPKRAFLKKPIKGLIAIHNVSFAYPRVPDHTILRDINLSIYPNEKVAIVGPTGAGKSTLLNLLLGFYQDYKGKIYIDGINIKDLNPYELRDQISIVDQDPELFSASIFENVLYGNPKASESSVKQVLDLVFPDAWAEKFPRGINTIIGPRGFGLSVGQKQCIAMARALLRNAQIILFDEATSGLDGATEMHLTKNVFPLLKNRTVLMVTHKMSSILSAARIVVLKDGQIMATGNHEQLYQSNLLYRRLVNIEMKAG